MLLLVYEILVYFFEYIASVIHEKENSAVLVFKLAKISSHIQSALEQIYL